MSAAAVAALVSNLNPSSSVSGGGQGKVAATKSGSKSGSNSRPSRSKVPITSAQQGRRKRRRRETKEELAGMYSQFYSRIPADATPEKMAAEFADKELRVIMSQNGVLINEFDPVTGRYTEKTKLQKIESILAMACKSCLASPMSLKSALDVQRVRTTGSGNRAASKAAKHKLAPLAVGRAAPLAIKEEGAVGAGICLELASPSESSDGEAAASSAPASPLTEVSARTPVTKQEELDVLELLSSLVTVANEKLPGAL